MYGLLMASAILLICVGIMVFTRKSSGVGKAVDSIVSELLGGKPAEEVMKALEPFPAADRLKILDEAFARLWEDYKRKEAASVLEEMVRLAPETKITLFRLKQLVEVEPDLAVKRLGLEKLRSLLGIEEAAPVAPAEDEGEQEEEEVDEAELDAVRQAGLAEELREEDDEEPAGRG